MDFIEMLGFLCFKINKQEVEKLLEKFDIEVVEYVKGQYEESIDGYIVVKYGGGFYKLDFYDDSYDSGYLEYVTKVEPKTKTVTVWE